MNAHTPHTHGGTDAPECTQSGTRCQPPETESPAVQWTVDQHYAAGVARGLGEAYAYLLRFGPAGMGEWLKRRERAHMVLLPTDEHGNAQFTP